MRRFLFALFICFGIFTLIPAFIGSAFAGDDQDAARRALARGEIMPLRDILDRVEDVLPGNSVIRVKFDRDDGIYIYKLKVIDVQGVLREVELDAKTGMILEIEVDD